MPTTTRLGGLPDSVRRIAFNQGWTVDIECGFGGYLYLDWMRTGSQDPFLSDMLPEEARELAAALIHLSDVAEANGE